MSVEKRQLKSSEISKKDVIKQKGFSNYKYKFVISYPGVRLSPPAPIPLQYLGLMGFMAEKVVEK